MVDSQRKCHQCILQCDSGHKIDILTLLHKDIIIIFFTCLYYQLKSTGFTYGVFEKYGSNIENSVERL